MPVPYATFRAALDAGNLERVVMLAREMPPMRLDDALRVVLLMRDGDPTRFDRACVRWLARFCLETSDVSLEDVQAAAAALDLIPHDAAAGMAVLQQLCLRLTSAG